MKLNRVMYDFLNLLLGWSCRNTSINIRRIGRITSCGFLNYNQVFHLLDPACLKILFSVPGAKSWFGFPAIVTKPCCIGCLYCWWLPLVLTKYQPSFFSKETTSLTFTRVYILPWSNLILNLRVKCEDLKIIR